VLVLCSRSNDTGWKSKKEHKEILEIQQSVGSAGAAWGCIEPASVLLSYGRVVLAQPGSNSTSNSIIHVHRSQLGTCYNNITAAVGSRLPLQRLDHTDRWLKFQFFFHAPVWRRSRTKCSGNGNRNVRKKDWNFSHRSVGSGRCRGSLNPAAAVGLWQNVPSCDRWTWMIELLAQTMKTW